MRLRRLGGVRFKKFLIASSTFGGIDFSVGKFSSIINGLKKSLYIKNTRKVALNATLVIYNIFKNLFYASILLKLNYLRLHILLFQLPNRYLKWRREREFLIE